MKFTKVTVYAMLDPDLYDNSDKSTANLVCQRFGDVLLDNIDLENAHIQVVSIESTSMKLVEDQENK